MSAICCMQAVGRWKHLMVLSLLHFLSHSAVPSNLQCLSLPDLTLISRLFITPKHIVSHLLERKETCCCLSWFLCGPHGAGTNADISHGLINNDQQGDVQHETLIIQSGMARKHGRRAKLYLLRRVIDAKPGLQVLPSCCSVGSVCAEEAEPKRRKKAFTQKSAFNVFSHWNKTLPHR